MISKFLAGVILGGLGTMLLSVTLQQSISPDTSAELFERAGVARWVTVWMFFPGMIIAVLAGFLGYKFEDRLKVAWPVAVLTVAASGVALSLAVSFFIAGLIVEHLPTIKWFGSLSLYPPVELGK